MSSTETRVTTRAAARAAASKSSPPHPSSFHTPATTKPHVCFQEPTKPRPHSSRRRPPHLQPLAIGQITPKQRRHSGTYIRYPVTGNALTKGSNASHYIEHPPQTPISASSLATPGLEQVRRYYRDNNLHTAFQAPDTPYDDNLSDEGHFPRASPSTSFIPTAGRQGSFGVEKRGSIIVTPTTQLVNHFGKLTTLSSVTACSPVQSPRFPPRTYRQRSIVDESREILLDGANRDELTRKQPRRPSEGVELGCWTPISKPPKDGLREWGSLYLGNAASADVFVRALHIRNHPSSQLPSSKYSVMSGVESAHGEEEHDMAVPKTENDFFMLRARVNPFTSPNTRERKPFMIQRKLSKVDLKAMAEAASKEQRRMRKQSIFSGAETHTSEEKGRSKSTSSSHTNGHGEGVVSPALPSRLHIDPKRVVMPIHMDYALKYLPILGLLMLSGHIRKGDTIDLPLPHPEAWNETVAYAYAGYREKDGLSEGAKENIVHLAGVVDDEETQSEDVDLDDNKVTKTGGN